MQCRQDATPRRPSSRPAGRPTGRPVRPPAGPAATLVPNDTSTSTTDTDNSHPAQRGTSSNGHATTTTTTTPSTVPSNAPVSHCNHHIHTVVCHIEDVPPPSPFDDNDNDLHSAAFPSAPTPATTPVGDGLQAPHPSPDFPSSPSSAAATTTFEGGAEQRGPEREGRTGSDRVLTGSPQTNGGSDVITAPGRLGGTAGPSPTVVVSRAGGDGSSDKGDGSCGGGGRAGGRWGFAAGAAGLVAGEAQGAEPGGSQEKRHSHQSVASNDSVSSEASSVSKRARRLAKKVPSMSPGAKWRRLRNTLKAAHEMQAPKKKQALSREDSFLRKFSTRNQRLHSQFYSSNDDGGFNSSNTGGAVPRNNNEPRSFKPPRNLAVQHDGNFMFKWLGVVTVAVLYNLWTCILRQAFREVQSACHACWITFDVLVDIVYLLDILVQFRTGYLNQGLMVYDSRKLAQRYIQSRLLYVDALCLFPLDLLQLSPHIGVHPMIRFPRFIKVYRTFRFIHMLESRTAYPNLIRVANLTHILFLGAHWFAAFYYMISEAEDFKGKWSYPEPDGEYAFVSRKYLASLFWSTLTLTTIGDLPPPENGKE